MRIRILGSAAGGGLPQWNCRCANCEAARTGSGDVEPRTQSSVAVSADGRMWFLLNVSADVRQQVLAFGLGPPVGQRRGTSIAGCVLTDAELDHTTGLLQLREGCTFGVYCTGIVRHWLNRQLPIEPVLKQFAPRAWREMTLGLKLDLKLPDGSASGISVSAFDVEGHAPKYVTDIADGQSGAVVGLRIEDHRTGGVLVYAPCTCSLNDPLQAACQRADCILFDGTFWDDEEPVRHEIGSRTARQMGHMPVSGPHGSLDWLAALPARHRVYVHINNTNPMLGRNAHERRLVEDHGVRVGMDGDSFEI